MLYLKASVQLKYRRCTLREVEACTMLMCRKIRYLFISFLPGENLHRKVWHNYKGKRYINSLLLRYLNLLNNTSNNCRYILNISLINYAYHNNIKVHFLRYLNSQNIISIISFDVYKLVSVKHANHENIHRWYIVYSFSL